MPLDLIDVDDLAAAVEDIVVLAERWRTRLQGA
jgi:hypothetical protein